MSEDPNIIGEGGIEIPPHLQEWTEGQRLIDVGGQLGLVDRADYRADQYENYPDAQFYVSNKDHSIWVMPGNSSNDDPDLFELFQLQDRELGTEWTDGSLRLAPVNDSTGGQERDATALELAEHTGQPGTRFFIGHDGVTLYAVYPSGTVEHLSHARIIPNAEAVEVDPVASPVAHGEETVRGQAGQVIVGANNADDDFEGFEIPPEWKLWNTGTQEVVNYGGRDDEPENLTLQALQMQERLGLSLSDDIYIDGDEIIYLHEGTPVRVTQYRLGSVMNANDESQTEIEFDTLELPADAQSWTDGELQIEISSTDGHGFTMQYAPAQLRLGLALATNAQLFVSVEDGTIYVVTDDNTVRALSEARCTDVSPLSGEVVPEADEEVAAPEASATPESTAGETRVNAMSLLAHSDYWGPGDEREISVDGGESVMIDPDALRQFLGLGANVELYIGNDSLVRGYIAVEDQQRRNSSRVEQDLGREVRVVESDDPIIEMVPEDWELWNEGSRSIIIATGDGNVQMSFTPDELCHHFNIEPGIPLYIQPNGAIGRLDDTGNTVTILDATDADSVRTPEEEPPEQVAIEIPNDWTPWSIGERRVRIGRDNIHTLTPQQLVERHMSSAVAPGTQLYINEKNEICVMNAAGFEEVYGDAVVLPEELEIPPEWLEWSEGSRVFIHPASTSEISLTPAEFIAAEGDVPAGTQMYIDENGTVCCVVDDQPRVFSEYELVEGLDDEEPPFEEPPENINLPVGWVEWADGTGEIIAVTEAGATNNERMVPADLITRENLPVGTTIYIAPNGQIGYENPTRDPSAGFDDSYLSFGPKYVRLDPSDPNTVVIPPTWNEWTADERYFTHATAGQMRLDPAGLIAREPMLPAGARLFVDDSGNLCYIHGSHQQPNTGYQQFDVPPNLTQWTNGDTRMLLDSSSGQDFLNVDPAGLMADGRYSIPQGSMLFIDDSNQVCFIDAGGTQQTLPNCRVIDSTDPLHIVGTNNWAVWNGRERRFEHTTPAGTVEVMLNEAALRARETALSADAQFYLDNSGNLCYILHGSPESNTGYRVLDVPDDFTLWTDDPVWYTVNDGSGVIQKEFTGTEVAARESGRLPAGARLYRDSTNLICYMDNGPKVFQDYHPLTIPNNYDRWESNTRRVQRVGGPVEELDPAGIISRETGLLPGTELFVDNTNNNVMFFDERGRAQSASYTDVTNVPIAVPGTWNRWLDTDTMELAHDDGRGGPATQLPPMSCAEFITRTGLPAGTELYLNPAGNVCCIENNSEREFSEYTLSVTVPADWDAWNVGERELAFDDGSGPVQVSMTPATFRAQVGLPASENLYTNPAGNICYIHNNVPTPSPEYMLSATVPPEWTPWPVGETLEFDFNDGTSPPRLDTLDADGLIGRNNDISAGTPLYHDAAGHIWCLHNGRRHEIPYYTLRNPTIPADWNLWPAGAFLELAHTDTTGVVTNMNIQENVFIANEGLPARTPLYINGARNVCCVQNFRLTPFTEYEQRITAPQPVVPPPAPAPAPLVFAVPANFIRFPGGRRADIRNDRTGEVVQLNVDEIRDECGFPVGTEIYADRTDGTLHRVLPGEDRSEEIPNYGIHRLLPAPGPGPAGGPPGGPRRTPDPLPGASENALLNWAPIRNVRAGLEIASTALWNSPPVRGMTNAYNWLGTRISNATQGRFGSNAVSTAEGLATGAAFSLPAMTRAVGWAGFDGLRETLTYGTATASYYALSMLGPLAGPLSVLAPTAFSGANRGRETGREYRAVLDLAINPEDSIANQNAQWNEMNTMFRTDLRQKQDELIDTKDEVALMQALHKSKLVYPPDVARMSTLTGGDQYYAEYTLARMTALASMCTTARAHNADAIDTPDFDVALDIIGRGMNVDLQNPANGRQRREVEQQLREAFNRLSKEQKLMFASHNIVNPRDEDVDDSLLEPAARDSADLHSRTRIPRVLPDGVSATCSKTDASVTIVLSGVPSVTLYPTIGPDGTDRPVPNALIRAAADRMKQEAGNVRNVAQLYQDTNIDVRAYPANISVNIDQTDATVDVVFAGQPGMKLTPIIGVGGTDVAVSQTQVDNAVSYLTSVYAPATPGVPSTDVARVFADTSVPPYFTTSDVTVDISRIDASVTLTLGSQHSITLYPQPDTAGFRAVSEYEMWEAAAALERRQGNMIDYADLASRTHIPPGYDPPCTFIIDADDGSVRIEVDKVPSVELHPDWEHETPVRMEQIRATADGMIQRKYGALQTKYPPALRRQQLIQCSIAYGRMVNNNHRERGEGRVRGAILGPMVLSGALGMLNPVMGVIAGGTYGGRYWYRRWRKGKSNLELNPDNPEGELQGRDAATIINPEIQKRLGGAHIAHEGTIANYEGKKVDAIESNKAAKYWYDKINFAHARPGYENRRYKDAMHLARHVAQEVQTGLADEVPPPVDYDSDIDKREKAISGYENKIISALKTMQPGRNGPADPSAIRIAEGQIRKHEAAITKLEEEKAEFEKKKDEAGKPIGLEKAGNDPAIRVAFAVHVQEEFSILAQKQHWATRIASGAAGIATSEGAIKAGKAVAAPLAVGGLAGAGAYGAVALGGAAWLAPAFGVGIGLWIAGSFVRGQLTGKPA